MLNSVYKFGSRHYENPTTSYLTCTNVFESPSSRYKCADEGILIGAPQDANTPKKS